MLPKMAKAAKSPELKKAFEAHKMEIEGYVERLTDVFELIGKAREPRHAIPSSASSARERQ